MLTPNVPFFFFFFLPLSRLLNKVTNGAIVVCFMIYFLMGSYGYLDFRHVTQGNILNNYCLQTCQDPIITVAFIAITITVLMAFPLNTFPCRYALEVYYKPIY